MGPHIGLLSNSHYVRQKESGLSGRAEMQEEIKRTGSDNYTVQLDKH